MSLVKGTSRKASSLKLMTHTSSCGLDSRTIAKAAASTRVRLVLILPLSSITIPSDTGTSSRRKILICCGWPFSKILKSPWLRLVSSLPLLAVTLACKTTSLVSERNWADRQPTKRLAANALLSRRIVPQSKISLERRQATRLIELHLYFPVLAIPFAILGRIAQDIFVAQLYADLGGDVR